jgi:hypothetical protein
MPSDPETRDERPFWLAIIGAFAAPISLNHFMDGKVQIHKQLYFNLHSRAGFCHKSICDYQ